MALARQTTSALGIVCLPKGARRRPDPRVRPTGGPVPGGPGPLGQHPPRPNAPDRDASRRRSATRRPSWPSILAIDRGSASRCGAPDPNPHCSDRKTGTMFRATHPCGRAMAGHRATRCAAALESRTSPSAMKTRPSSCARCGTPPWPTWAASTKRRPSKTSSKRRCSRLPHRHNVQEPTFDRIGGRHG